MNNAEAKKVIEKLRQKNCFNEGLTMDAGTREKTAEALSHCLAILDKLEQKGGVLPEEEELKEGISESYTKGFNACRQEVALNLVRFEERLKKNNFENFLMEQHAKDYTGTDDMMPDAFNEWVVDLGADELIEYGNKYTQSISAELRKK